MDTPTSTLPKTTKTQRALFKVFHSAGERRRILSIAKVLHSYWTKCGNGTVSVLLGLQAIYLVIHTDIVLKTTCTVGSIS